MKKILLIILISFLFSCSESEKKAIIQNNDTTLPPDQISYNVKVIFNDSSYKKAVLTANRARIYSSISETYLDGNLKIEFFSKSTGARATTLTADSAKIDDKTKDMYAWGKVIVIADSSQTRLESEELKWSQETKKFYSKKFVKITSPNEIIQGSGFESDQNLKNYKIYQSSGEKR